MQQSPYEIIKLFWANVPIRHLRYREKSDTSALCCAQRIISWFIPHSRPTNCWESYGSSLRGNRSSWATFPRTMLYRNGFWVVRHRFSETPHFRWSINRELAERGSAEPLPPACPDLGPIHRAATYTETTNQRSTETKVNTPIIGRRDFFRVRHFPPATRCEIPDPLGPWITALTMLFSR